MSRELQTSSAPPEWTALDDEDQANWALSLTSTTICFGVWGIFSYRRKTGFALKRWIWNWIVEPSNQITLSRPGLSFRSWIGKQEEIVNRSLPSSLCAQLILFRTIMRMANTRSELRWAERICNSNLSVVYVRNALGGQTDQEPCLCYQWRPCETFSSAWFQTLSSTLRKWCVVWQRMNLNWKLNESAGSISWAVKNFTNFFELIRLSRTTVDRTYYRSTGLLWIIFSVLKPCALSLSLPVKFDPVLFIEFLWGGVMGKWPASPAHPSPRPKGLWFFFWRSPA